MPHAAQDVDNKLQPVDAVVVPEDALSQRRRNLRLLRPPTPVPRRSRRLSKRLRPRRTARRSLRR